ncbi:MAG: hypothetical protein J7L26_12710 [Candidatus Aminicenantes bacterium]|nr:hypothetical protein [Candidatus Aminicenantes bacterium]
MIIKYNAQSKDEIEGILHTCKCPYCGKWIIAFASKDNVLIKKEKVKEFIYYEWTDLCVAVHCNLVFNPCPHFEKFDSVSCEFVFKSPELPEENHDER